jgi:hypothetical protein
MHGHIEHIPIRVLHEQIFPIHPAQIAHDEAGEAADPVFQVHNVIPRFDVGEMGLRRRRPRFAPTTRRRSLPAKQLRIGEQDQQHPIILPADKVEPFEQAAFDER